MNQETRNSIFSNMFAKMLEVTTKKGHDYSGDEDVLANFKRNAEALGLTKYQVWHVYFRKHIDSIAQSIKDNPEFPKDGSEPLEGRLIDAMVYLLLMHCMREEDQHNRITHSTNK